MSIDPALLRKKFFRFLIRYQEPGNGRYSDQSGVYVILGFKQFPNDFDIFYVGSTKNMAIRWKSHNKIPNDIINLGYLPSLLFIPMSKDLMNKYEIKLIKKLRPRFNVQHKEG